MASTTTTRSVSHRGVQRRFDGTKWITVQDTVYSGLLYYVKEKSSVDTGKFTPGVYRVNPYTIATEEYDVPMGSHTYKYTYYGTYEMTWTGHLLGPGIAGIRNTSTSAKLPTMELEALTKAYSKVGSGSLALSEDLGEIRETIEMLRNPITAMRKFLRNSDHANRKKLKKLLQYLISGKYGKYSGTNAAKAAAENYLQFRYGWRPLVMTLGDVLEEVRKKKQNNWIPGKIRSARAIVKGSDSSISATLTSFPLLFGTGYGQAKTHDELKATASVQYLMSMPITGIDNLGLTPRFWPETAWELTRLSFVVDWVINIGPFLGSLRVKPNVQILGATSGKRLERKVTLQGVKIYTGYGEGIAGKPLNGTATWTYNRYERKISTLPSHPVLRLGDVMDLYKSIDSLALLIQRMF